MSAYQTCKKCGLRHSTAVRHKCPREKLATPDRPKLDNELTDPTEGGPGMGSGEGGEGGEGESQGEGEGKGQGQGDGEGEQGEGEGQDGEGEGEEGKPGDQGEEGEGGEGEERQGEGSGQGSSEPPPPPAAVVVTVLKFAALTAACRESFINVTLGENGLIVFGQNGDEVAMETIPWGEFEKRSTIDGEYYVKSVIDAVDAKVGGSGQIGEITMPPAEPSIDWDAPIVFLNGKEAFVWDREFAPSYLIGIPPGEGGFSGDDVPGGAHRKLSAYKAKWGEWDGCVMEVDEYGKSNGEPVVRNR